MADSSLYLRLRGLILSASDLRAMTTWPSALIEDYLSIIENLISIATAIDTGSGIGLNIQTITTDYTTIGNDGVILIDCSSNNVTVSFDDSAVEGQVHSFKCIDDTNHCYLNPNGNNMDDDSNPFEIYLDESVTVKADSSNNWWII